MYLYFLGMFMESQHFFFGKWGSVTVRKQFTINDTSFIEEISGFRLISIIGRAYIAI